MHPALSFVPYGLYRVKHRRLLRRIPAKEHACGGTHKETQQHTPRLYEHRPLGENVNSVSGAYTISTPMTPPVTLKRIDSIKNWLNMSIPLAPTLMRKPISRVRSVTLTYIMFIMPMPPTIKDIPAIQARSIVIRSVVEFIMLASSSCERMLKSSSSPSCSSVASFNLC